jgi:Reverse transcriptase (RNA-dependent DNA polymerase)
MAIGCKNLTSFKRPVRNSKYLVMLFAMSNSPSAFQRAITKALFPISGCEICVYLDNIILGTHTIECNIYLLERKFPYMLKNNLSVQSAKWDFYKEKGKFLGHVNNQG